MATFSQQPKEHVLRKVREVPSLPEVVDKVVMLLSKPNTPASEVARLISYDPGLTSKVLRMVNSAAYGFQRQISSIQHAIMILGFNTVRGLVLSSSIFKLLGKSGPSEQAHERLMWEHCLMTAMTARILGQYFRMPETDDAFSAGLLHDVGKIIFNVYFPKDYHFVLERVRKQKLPGHGSTYLDIENEILGTTHTEIGGFLANKWRLPISISQVIEFHHAPASAEFCQPLVHLIAFADEMCHFIQAHLPSTLPNKPLDVSLLEADVEPEIRCLCDPEAALLQFSPHLVSYFHLKPEELAQLIEAVHTEMVSSQALLEDFSAA